MLNTNEMRQLVELLDPTEPIDFQCAQALLQAADEIDRFREKEKLLNEFVAKYDFLGGYAGLVPEREALRAAADQQKMIRAGLDDLKAGRISDFDPDDEDLDEAEK